MPENLDPLFPEVPEDLAGLKDDEIAGLLEDHEAMMKAIRDDSTQFSADLTAEEFLAEARKGKDQLLALRAESEARAQANQNFNDELAKITEVAAEAEPEQEEAEVVAESGDEGDGDGDDGGDEAGAPAEAEVLEPVLAAGEPEQTPSVPVQRFSRRPPAPAPDRIPVVASTETALVAAGELAHKGPEPLTPLALAELSKEIMRLGPLPKTRPAGETRFGGQEHKIARAEYTFPEERTLNGSDQENTEKIRAALPEYVTFAGGRGGHGGEALTASGGLCAPATPFYGMVNFATDAEPVWDSLPVFRATRGSVNVPESTIISDITTAISSISEANDALGGTFATKSCQDLTCPAYTETAVNIFAHCREYGNLNAISWPEKIAHENALTMAALARTSEMFMLERIKALSVNVTSGAATLSMLTYLVDAIAKSKWGIMGRLRTPRTQRFRAVLPEVLHRLWEVDSVQNPYDRFKTSGDFDAYLRSIGVDPIYYIDGDFAAGDDMTPDASQTAGALDPWPNTFQWGFYPEGAFLGIDMGTLELGIVRDSTLNATNDFQVFGERFRNLVRLAPAQACYWETTTLCAVGTFPPAGTARTCES